MPPKRLVEIDQPAIKPPREVKRSSMSDSLMTQRIMVVED